MAQEADVPAGLWGRIEKLIEDKIGQFQRSGFLRNAAISGGSGLSIRDGGVLRLVTADGVELFYIGPLGPAFPDGRPQQGWSVRRADNTSVLSLFDVDVSDGVARQALNWWDRSGRIVLADDTDSGQGLARPYVPAQFFRTRFGDWNVATTSAAFETLWDARMYMQQPRLVVGVRASMDTAGTTGEVKVQLSDGTQLGSTAAVGFAIGEYVFGPVAVAGEHLSALTVQVQGRRTSASGALRVEPLYAYGLQT